MTATIARQFNKTNDQFFQLPITVYFVIRYISVVIVKEPWLIHVIKATNQKQNNNFQTSQKIPENNSLMTLSVSYFFQFSRKI